MLYCEPGVQLVRAVTITDVKQSLPSALDFARLEGRMEVVERKLGISTTTS